MGDVNNDNRDDFCVYTHFDDPEGVALPLIITLECDTAHNGGSAEFSMQFGEITETYYDFIKIGDIDGNGTDDICVARYDSLDLTFMCDTANNGGWAETYINYGDSDDYDIHLADINGDGKDDPCIRYITGATNTISCDTAHNGGAAELSINFGLSSDQILLGNVDGIGAYPLFRFYSSVYQTHFFTSSVTEKNTLINNPNWTYEGAWNNIFNQQEYASVPVYRLVRNGTQKRFYTRHESEKNALVASGAWTYEWIAYYVYPSQKPNTTGVRRFYRSSTQTHFYTSNLSEINSLKNSGQWTDEGIVWYVPN
jgi:hypothetical protein